MAQMNIRYLARHAEKKLNDETGTLTYLEHNTEKVRSLSLQFTTKFAEIERHIYENPPTVESCESGAH